MIIMFGSHREASVALRVWQPEVIRARQRQIVEQCSVSVDSRLRTLDMELKLCELQISISRKALVSFKCGNVIFPFDNNCNFNL